MKEKLLSCSVFVQSDEHLKTLTDLLSEFKSLKVTTCIQNLLEALELLNKNKIDLLFMDVDYADYLQLIRKPSFIIGLCDKKRAKNLIRYLRVGFFDFITTPVEKDELLIVMGKVLNTYGTYNYVFREKVLEANENEIPYNKSSLEKSLFTKDSMFLNGRRKSESMRIAFDDVQYVKLIDGKIVLFFENGSTKQLHTTLKYFQKKLPSEKFQKINRNVIVNIDKVTKISPKDEIWVGMQPLKVSRSFRKSLRKTLDL